MSAEDVDRFREAMAAFNRLVGSAGQELNREALGELLGFMDPQIQFEPQQAELQGSYRGHEGVLRWLADLAEHYQGGHVRLAEVRDLGGQVLALGTLHFIGMGSGIETEAPLTIVASFRNGLMTHFKDYGDRDRAFEALGLSA